MTELDENPTPRRKTISNPYIHRLQRRHFLLFDVLPIIGTVAAFAFLAVRPFGVVEFALLFGMWLVTGLGVTVGYHRLFTHRTFKAAPWVAALLAILGSMAGQGGVVSWVALHRRHHEFSDREEIRTRPIFPAADSPVRYAGWHIRISCGCAATNTRISCTTHRI